MPIVHGLFGLAVLIGFCWLVSENRRAVKWRVAVAGLAVQFIVAAILLKAPGSQQVFVWLNEGFLAVLDATTAGTSLVFGYIGGGSLPFTESFPGAAFVLAFQALPVILVTSALSAVLYYWRVLPLIVRAFAWVLQRSMGVGGAVGVSSAANIFVGMIEAPLFVRPYLKKISRSELFMVMTVGMATIAGTVFVLYASFLKDIIPNAAGHLLTASIISAPAAIMIAKLMVPNDGTRTGEGTAMEPSPDHSAMDAVTRGTSDGVRLLINVIAMLIVFVALVSLINKILGLFPDLFGEPIALQRLFGWVFAPVVWLLGIPWSEAPIAGSLLGTKTVLNELIAFLQWQQVPAEAMSERSKLIMVYALSGFANFGSLGIMLGGLTTMVPGRRKEIVGLGMKSIVSGTIATCMTGAVAGILF
ncbi:MAG: nucleoside:proton symporter [Rhodospirillales bacterium]|nr:nucleoside:proton symporter [Rhodospirillales bacterium]